MQIESSLSIFGLMAIAVAYILLLLAFTVVEEERMLFIISGFGGMLLGLVMLGFAKIIRLQQEINQHLNTLTRFSRAQTQAMTELTATKTAKPHTQKVNKAVPKRTEAESATPPTA